MLRYTLALGLGGAIALAALPAYAVTTVDWCTAAQPAPALDVSGLDVHADAVSSLLTSRIVATEDYHLGSKPKRESNGRGRSFAGGRGGMRGRQAGGMMPGIAALPGASPSGLPGAQTPGLGAGGFSFNQKLYDHVDARGGLQATPNGMIRLNGDGTYNLGPVYAGVGVNLGTVVGTTSAPTGGRLADAGRAGAGFGGLASSGRRLASRRSGSGAIAGAAGGSRAGRPQSLFRLGSGANSASAELTVGTHYKLGPLEASVDWRYSGDQLGTFDGNIGLPF